jgi:hypothetical protein
MIIVPRKRQYASDAERQRAYRARKRARIAEKVRRAGREDLARIIEQHPERIPDFWGRLGNQLKPWIREHRWHRIEDSEAGVAVAGVTSLEGSHRP